MSASPNVAGFAAHLTESSDETPRASPPHRRTDDGTDDDDGDYEDMTDETTTGTSDGHDDEMTESETGTAEDTEAPEDAGDVEVEFTVEESTEEEDEEEERREEEGSQADAEARPRPAGQPRRMTRQDLLELLGGQAAFGRLFVQHFAGARAAARRAERGLDEDDSYEDEDEDDEDEDEDTETDTTGLASLLNARRRRRREIEYPKPPFEAGTRLMNEGQFGHRPPKSRLTSGRPIQLSEQLMRRELGIYGDVTRQNRLMTQNMIPATVADTIIHYDSRCYSGQFSEDGNFFFACGQDFKVRMYDTSDPYHWRYYKTVEYPGGQWTITDASLSPDNKLLAYSSMHSVVCVAATDPSGTTDPIMLDFLHADRRRGFPTARRSFAVWSLRFSGDGREIVAGTQNHSIYVYDIETRQSLLQIRGHQNEVNAVCFGDRSSPHLLYSGSDDSTLKVWDRRSMGDSREAGVFVGHTEGLTYIDSKGDGRYVLSNGKDQTMKLWDLRKMMSTDRFDRIDPLAYSHGFDYRFMPFEEANLRPHPHDCSLVTYRGHRVLKTLIRCHFSPPGSSDSRYVYTGSEGGAVHVYNIDGTLASKIDVRKATHRSRPRDANGGVSWEDHGTGGNRSAWRTCVRDASWHPHVPLLVASSWNGWGMTNGTCTVHSWSDGIDEDDDHAPLGSRVDQHLQYNPDFYDRPVRAEQDGDNRPGIWTRHGPIGDRMVGRRT